MKWYEEALYKYLKDVDEEEDCCKYNFRMINESNYFAKFGDYILKLTISDSDVVSIYLGDRLKGKIRVIGYIEE